MSALPARIEDNILARTPVSDQIDPRMFALIKSTVASDDGITPAELAYFLELAAQYQLDPFAREVWIAKSKSGKLLIMVGRDGLRRIASRNGIHVDSDVVHVNDEFSVTRLPNGDRNVTHQWSVKDRGEIVGAWAECREGGPDGRSMGFFYADLKEFKPDNASSYSPWSKQVSAMITGAAERQAIRKATPLGGLLVEGEQEIVSDAVEIGAGEGDGSEPGWDPGLDDDVVEAIESLLKRAEAVSFPALADRATVQMRLNGQDRSAALQWIGQADEQLKALEGGES